MFVEIAWLYGVYNLSIVLFSIIDRLLPEKGFVYQQSDAMPQTPVAMLYTTCNDFIEESARSCINLDYKNFRLYILDDSSKPEYKAKIDIFANKYPSIVQVIRRKDRSGYKAGNLNNTLS